MCKFFLQGSCRFGEKCLHAHIAESKKEPTKEKEPRKRDKKSDDKNKKSGDKKV